MSWELVRTCDGDFIYNWVAVQQIARNFSRAQSMVKNAKTIEENSLNPFVPNTATVDVDFALVRKEVDTNSKAIVGILRSRAENSALTVRNELISMLQQTRTLNNQYEQKVKDAQNRTMQSINQAVYNGTVAESVARGIRDASAEILILGATVVTGGTAGAVIFVAGPALKGVAKYQDTGSFASAGIEFGVSLGLNKLGKVIDARQAAGAITAGENIMLNILATKASNAKEPLQAWLEGGSVSEGLASAAMKSSTAAGTELGKAGTVELIKETENVRGIRFGAADFRLSGKAFLATAALTVAAVATDRIVGAISKSGDATPSAVLPVPPQVILWDALPMDEKFLNEFAQRQVTTIPPRFCP